MIDLSRYDPDDVKRIETWIEFVADLMAIDEANADRLRTALANLANSAEQRYPALERGEWVCLDVPDLGEWELPEQVGSIFVALTGDVLFLGVDGPRLTAAVLHETIDKIDTRLKEKANAD